MRQRHAGRSRAQACGQRGQQQVALKVVAAMVTVVRQRVGVKVAAVGKVLQPAQQLANRRPVLPRGPWPQCPARF